MPATSRLRYRVATLAAILLFVSSLVTGGAIYHRQQQVEQKLLENLVWATYQFDREVREKRMALLQASDGDVERLLLRHEILISRATLFQRGQLHQALLDTPLIEAVRTAVEAALTLDSQMLPIEAGEQSLDDATREMLDAELAALQSLTATLLIDVNTHVSTLRHRERNELLSLYGVVLGLIVLLMASGSVLVLLLIREGREHAAKTRQLQQRTDELDATARLAEKASQAKSEFMAVMSHEIRTPLNGVVGVADLLSDEPLPGRSRELLRSLNDSVLSLQAVIDDVIDYTRYESGGLELDARPFELGPFIDQLSRGYRLEAERRGLVFEARIEPGLPAALEGDIARLRQVLMNLLNNAFKFTAEGAISFRVEQAREGSIRFLVRDTGCGIPEESREALFKPFSQIDRGISRRYGGSGLGLAICARLISSMGGRIDVESHAGLGSLFWFEVPLPEVSLEEARRHPGSATSSADLPELAPRRILVVEDQATNRELARAMLERLGQSVKVAENGQVALELLTTETFDLVLMDMQMPVLGGLTTTRHWREREAPSGRRLPIVAMTANVMPEDRERCLAAGMDEVLGKPFTRQDLYRLLQGALPGGTALAPACSPCDRHDAESEALIDLATLASLEAGLDGPTLRDLMTRFLGRLGERQQLLVEALDRVDLEAVAEGAHALKGAAASMGCQGLARAAADLEHCALIGEAETTELESLVAHIARLGNESREALNQLGYLAPVPAGATTPSSGALPPTSSSR
ncbi:ATP-binding protein [Halomonas mongoliensis]|uniref:ATP-binding protein n=1 Tax=Halomonas mongoliensis TaxID=321265 RepID=UPI00403AAF74